MTRIKLIYWIIVMILLIISFSINNHPDWFTYGGFFFIVIGYLIQTIIPITYYKKIENNKETTKFAKWSSKIIL